MNTEDKHPLRFEDIPEVLGWIKGKLIELEAKIDAAQDKNKLVEEDRWLSVQDVSDYLPEHPAVQTLYTWTSAKRIPYHKDGKRLRFLKSEIDTWLKKPEALFKSIEQIEDEAKVKAQAIAFCKYIPHTKIFKTVEEPLKSKEETYHW